MAPADADSVAISVRDISKKYHMYSQPIDRLKEYMTLGRKSYHREFWALKDISFDVPQGRAVGVIGRNGSGKSTLLQIICSILPPSSGQIITSGRVSALLELGAGFNPEFTGRENVLINGQIIGLTRDEIEGRFDDIAAFADIGDFIDQPVKTYSSGMYVRLAFAAAINIDPAILIVDEVLAVGDMFFQAKCMARMKKMLNAGMTLLFVTHDIGVVKSLCHEAILLDRGRMLQRGRPDSVVEKYFSMKVKTEQETIEIPPDPARVQRRDVSPEEPTKHSVFDHNQEFLRTASFQRIQNGKTSFANVLLLDASGQQLQSVRYEQEVILRTAIDVHENNDVLSFGYHIRDKNGIDVVYSGSNIENKNLQNVKKGERYIVDWRFRMSLAAGNYSIACVLSVPIDLDIGKVEFCDFVPIAVQFQMQPRTNAKLYGYVHWDNLIEIEKS